MRREARNGILRAAGYGVEVDIAMSTMLSFIHALQSAKSQFDKTPFRNPWNVHLTRHNERIEMKSNTVNGANVEVLPAPNVANCQLHKGGNQWYRKLGLATLATLATCSAAMAAEQNVRLMPSPFLDNTLRERRYLESLDPRALTRMFRVTSGLQKLTEGEDTIGGWEDPEIEVRGHTCGHWLSGMASLYELTRDETVKARSAEVVRILAECQAANGDGYVSAFPRKLIDKAIRGEPAWAPWYTLHKILAGLLDQYQCCGNAQALAVARGMGEWAAAKVLPLSAEQAATMR